LNGPWFMNTGYSNSEGANAVLNSTTLPITTASVVYGGNLGEYMGATAIGCLASWLTPTEQQSCRIRYIQRAIDVYSALKAGVCLETGAGIMPGYATLLTNAGVMMNNAGMMGVNNGYNGVKPYWMLADYATMWHTDNVPSTDLFGGEAPSERLISLYSSTTTNYPEYNKAGINPIVASASNTMTMATTFRWGTGGRPIVDCVNTKVRITAGSGASSTIYTITNAVTAGVTAAESFRNTSGTLYVSGGNTDDYVLGGKVQLEPPWTNGLPDSTSTITMSIFANDPSNPVASGYAKWFFSVVGRASGTTAKLDKVDTVSCSPTEEYDSIQTGGNIDNLIALYAMGQQSLYKSGLDKYLIQVGQIPGYGESMFSGSYLYLLGYDGASGGNARGAMWKQTALTPSGIPFVYTTGTTSSLPVVNPSAKLWNEIGIPAFTSASSTTFTAGQTNSFTAAATGNPPPTFSVTGLPAWATLNSATGVLTGTPPLAGSYTGTITAGNGVSTPATQTFTIKVITSFNAWAAQQGLTGANALPTAVLSPDKLTNLFKYALGLSPFTTYSPGNASLPKVQIQDISGTNYLTLTFTGFATDVTYSVQASSNLNVPWTTIKTFPSGSTAPGLQTVQDTQAIEATPQRYMRLIMTIP